MDIKRPLRWTSSALCDAHQARLVDAHRARIGQFTSSARLVDEIRRAYSNYRSGASLRLPARAGVLFQARFESVDFVLCPMTALFTSSFMRASYPASCALHILLPMRFARTLTRQQAPSFLSPPSFSLSAFLLSCHRPSRSPPAVPRRFRVLVLRACFD